jgi:eukaryotic-like serine/threonine-protein kinase
MGEVYRATDTTLGRDVALKVLLPEVTGDTERLARFRREAQLLASLNHPHIAAIHGLEEAGGQPFLVLELVEGETLQERLARGRIPLDDALPIARQIAEALEEAHEHGIVHRDLKPANVKLTPEGQVKVLDFGLAKAFGGDPEANSGDASRSPTLTREGTEAGVILGSAAYMSPEQARGRRVDKRADIWGFGAVLFEMLTGRRLFQGETVTDTLAAVLKTDPDWSRLPAGTPGRVRELLRRCLERDPRQRLRDIGDARLELELARASPQADEVTAASRPGRATLLVTGALCLAAGAAIVWGVGLARDGAPKGRPVTRFSVALAGDASLYLPNAQGTALAISRDGRQMVYVAAPTGRRRLQLRRLDDLAVRAIPETEGACNPFFSPDGEWIAFFTGEGMLKKVALAGGRPVVLARGLPNAIWMLGSWSDDGRIVFDGSGEGLRVVSAAGGAVTALSSPSSEGHWDPQVLPGSNIVLYQAQIVSRLRIEAISLGGKKLGTILENASRPRYLASGDLLFMRDGGVMVAPFDKDRLEITGPAVSVPLDVAVDSPLPSAPVPQLAASLEGTLVYVPFPAESLRSSALVWVDRQGVVEEAGSLPFAHPFFSLSPDGRRLAVTGRERGKARIDLFDVPRRAATRLIELDVDWPTGPVFSRDGRRLFLGRSDTEHGELLSLALDGSTEAEVILTVPALILTTTSVSPDGRFVAFYVFDKTSGEDVWVADLMAEEGQRARPFLVTPDADYGATFSPDGRLLAYVSRESGEDNVYVRRFPEGDAKTRVSTDAGLDPQWSRDGTELFYQSPDGRRLLAVPVREDRGLSFGAPRVLFEGPYLVGTDGGSTYAVSPDARHFLMTRQPNLAPLRSSELIVVQNWFEDVRRLTSDRRLP